MNWLVPALEIPQGYHWDMRKVILKIANCFRDNSLKICPIPQASEEGHKLPIDDYFKLGYENPEERVQR